jgi:NADH:ubiquinone reductase (H+-translocating)
MKQYKKPHVVIVGGGFAGLESARALSKADVDITLIDKTNYHLFQPLLYQVASAVLNPAEIAQPLRQILAYVPNLKVMLSELSGFELDKNLVWLGPKPIAYDYLIIAVGSNNFFFGHETWEKHAPGLKTIGDALRMRNNILSAYEQAEWANSEEERAACLNFVIVGAGPTGVELCGSLAEIASRTMNNNFRNFDPSNSKIILLEGGPRILPALPEKLSLKAHKELEYLGVKIMLNSSVESIDEEGVIVCGHKIAAKTVLWSAGVRPNPLLSTLKQPQDRTGRIIVEPDLSIKAYKNVMVLGDAAHFAHTADKNPLPAVAPVAQQMGRHAALNIRQDLQAKPRKSFIYKDLGTMAQVGRGYALAVIGPFKTAGFFAWILWAFVHIRGICGLDARLTLFFKWTWSYFTFARASRLVEKNDL